MAFMTASDVKVNPDLTAVLGQQGQGPQNSINDIFSKVRANFAKDAMTRGVKASPYADSRLNTTQGLASGNLRSGLEGVLGNTSYSDAKSQRDFNQNMELARLTGEMNKPSTLEEVLAGLNGGASLTGGGAALYQALQRRPQPRPAPEPMPSWAMGGGYDDVGGYF